MLRFSLLMERLSRPGVLRQCWLSGALAVACALILYPALAMAEECRIRVLGRDVALLRSPDYDGAVIRTVQEGDEFTAVTTVKDEFYLVKDEQTGSFLYVPFIYAEKIGEAPQRILVSGRMPMPEQMDPSYWQVAPDQADDPSEAFRMRSRASGGRLRRTTASTTPRATTTTRATCRG